MFFCTLNGWFFDILRTWYYNLRMWSITQYGYAIVLNTDVNPTKYGSDSCITRTTMIQNTDLIILKIRTLQVTYYGCILYNIRMCKSVRIWTIYGRAQYTDVDNIRTLTIYGRSASPYIVKSIYCQRPNRKSVYCKRPYIEKIAISQDIVNFASPYRVTPKTIYGLANVRILFFYHCDVYSHMYLY